MLRNDKLLIHCAIFAAVLRFKGSWSFSGGVYLMKPIFVALLLCLSLSSVSFAEENNTTENTPANTVDTTKVDTTKTDTDKASATVTPTPPPDSDMEFSLHEEKGGQCPYCRWISAEGNITPDTPARFTQFLTDNKLDNPSAYPNGLLLSFHSNGGDLLASIALGREIRKGNIDTTVAQTLVTPAADNKTDVKRVNGVCFESCLWAFLGGRSRTAPEGTIALRTFRPPLDGAGTTSGQEVDVRKQQLTDIAYIADYAQEMGFDPEIAFINWDNANPHVYTTDEIIDYHLTYSPDLIGKWHLVGSENTISAIAFSADQQTTARLYCDNQKTPFLEIYGPTHFKLENFEAYRQAVSTLEIWGMDIAITDLQANLLDGQVVYTLKLPKNPLQDWHVDSPYLSGKNAPDGLVNILNFEFADMPGLKQASTFVMANCPGNTH